MLLNLKIIAQKPNYYLIYSKTSSSTYCLGLLTIVLDFKNRYDFRCYVNFLGFLTTFGVEIEDILTLFEEYLAISLTNQSKQRWIESWVPADWRLSSLENWERKTKTKPRFNKIIKKLVKSTKSKCLVSMCKHLWIVAMRL